MNGPVEAAARLLGELGISEPEDIDVEAIAEYRGAHIVYEPLTGCEARILGNGSTAFITINSASRRGRQRFSAGHELGHWEFDRGRAAFRCTNRELLREWSATNPEQRANRFAVELLLPPSMFRPRSRNRQITLATAKELAEVFQTSLTATAIRLVEHGWFPSMVLCVNREGLRWHIRSRDIPRTFWARTMPTADSVAYDLLHGEPEPGPIDVAATAWFDDRHAKRYRIREDSCRINDDDVLTLLWWKDESHIIDASE